MDNSQIIVNNLYYSYEDNDIFNNLSLTIDTGKISSIISPSGSGKTTFLHLLAGILTPNSGAIIFPEKKPLISMVFQENRIIENTTVFKNIKLVNKNLSKEDITNLLTSLEINDCIQKKAKKLSGGQARRLAIARALAAKHDYLFLDEPFTGLDEKTKYKTMQYIKDNTKNQTVLLVTHNKEEADFFSSLSICINN